MNMAENEKNLCEVQPFGGFDLPLIYSYKETQKADIKIGSLVKIPLGKRVILGIVWSLNVTDRTMVTKLVK